MPSLTAEQVHQRLTATFGDAVGPLAPPKKDVFCTVKPERWREVARFLKTDPELFFDHLQDLTATDHPKENLIRVVCHLYSYRHAHLFVVKLEVDRTTAVLDSVESVWKSANWFEREVFDLFGVTFQGHPDLRRVMLPDDWVGHPLRKDYVEQGGYQQISNIRDNPLDLYLNMDRERRAAAPPPATEPAATAPAAPAAPAATEGK